MDMFEYVVTLPVLRPSPRPGRQRINLNRSQQNKQRAIETAANLSFLTFVSFCWNSQSDQWGTLLASRPP